MIQTMNPQEQEIFHKILEASKKYFREHSKKLWDGHFFNYQAYLPSQFNFWREARGNNHGSYGLYWHAEFLADEEASSCHYSLEKDDTRRLYHFIQTDLIDYILPYIRNICRIIEEEETYLNSLFISAAPAA